MSGVRVSAIEVAWFVILLALGMGFVDETWAGELTLETLLRPVTSQSMALECVPQSMERRGGSDCCSPHGGTGCDDPTCEAEVCSRDPVCCTVVWDAACAELAVGWECGDLCNSGNCCIANGTPGCQVPDCAQSVCQHDPFCCGNEWDSVCAIEASWYCDSATCESASDCCIPHGTTGCDNLVCEAIVCSLDSFCCAFQWDEACTQLAEATCGELCEVSHRLRVAILTPGGGTVTSTPPGINCPGDCWQTWEGTSATPVQLTATPAAGMTFLNWHGDDDCFDGMVLMDENLYCRAKFAETASIVFLDGFESGDASAWN